VFSACCGSAGPASNKGSTGASRPREEKQAQHVDISEADVRAIEAARRHLAGAGEEIPPDVYYDVERVAGGCIVHVVERTKIHVIEVGGQKREAIPLHGYEREVHMADPDLRLIQILSGP